MFDYMKHPGLKKKRRRLLQFCGNTILKHYFKMGEIFGKKKKKLAWKLEYILSYQV